MPTASRLRRAVVAVLALATVAGLLVTVPVPTFVTTQVFRSTVRTLSVPLPGGHAIGTAPFDALGLTLPAPPAAPVRVRGRVDGRWTAWAEAEFVADEAPDATAEPTRAGAHSEPVWFGDATAYEIRSEAPIEDLRVHLVRDRATGTTHRVELEGAGAAAAPTIARRAAWGARAPKATPMVTDDLKIAVVHHSVNGNTYSAAQVPALLRSIQAYHQDVQGWNDIAYNIAVDRFGRAWEARAGGLDQVVLGGHSQGFNTGSLGVVVLGDFTSTRATPAAVEAVAKVIAWKLALHRVDPASTVPFTTTGSSRYRAGTTVRLPRIVGHRDLQQTACPGAGLYGQLGAIRRRVAELVPQYQAGLPSHLVGADLDGNGYQDGVEQRLGPASDTAWLSIGVGPFIQVGVTVTSPQRPVAGDFDGDGRDDIVWHGSGSTVDRIWWAGGSSQQTVGVQGSYLPVAGDFDGDGVDDILWYAPGVSADAVWYGGRGRTFAKQSVRQDLIDGTPVVGDLDGDGRDDVFFYGRGASADTIWWSTGRGWRTQAVSAGGRYTVVAVHDGPLGRDDLLFIPPSGSASYRWAFDRSRRATGTALSVPGASGVATVGDFDGNGLEDVLLLARDGHSVLWFSSRSGILYRRYATAPDATGVSGRMELLNPRAEILVVSASGADQVWSIGADKSITRRSA